MEDLSQYIQDTGLAADKTNPAADDLSQYIQVQAAPTADSSDDLSQYVEYAPGEGPKETAVEEPHSTGLLGSFAKGLQRSVAPNTLTDEELLDRGTFDKGAAAKGALAGAGVGLLGGPVGSLVGGLVGGVGAGNPQLLGQIAGGVGASAAAAGAGAAAGAAFGPPGAIVGGLTGATLGSLSGAAAWGLYSNIATETAEARAEHRDINPVTIALGTAADINPVTKGTKLAMGARQAILQAAHAYSQTGDIETATLAGTVGAVIGGLAGSQAEKEFVADLASASVAENKGLHAEELMGMIKASQKDNGALVVRAADEIAAKPAEFFELPDRVKTMIKSGQSTGYPEDEDFIRSLTADPNLKFIRNAGDRVLNISDLETKLKPYTGMDEENLASRYREFKEYQIKQDIFADDIEQAAVDLTGLKDPLDGSLMARKLKPAVFNARAVDSVTGSAMEDAVNEMSKATNIQADALSGFVPDIKALLKRAKKLGADPEEFGRAHEGKSSLGVWDTDKGQALLADSRALMDRARQFMVDKGYKVGYIEDYFPQVSKGPAFYVKAIKDEAARLAEKYPGQELADVGEANNLMRVLSFIKDNSSKEVLTIGNKEIDKLADKILTPSSFKDFIGFQGSAYFKRTGQMPDFIRDFHYGRAMLSYINSNFKTIHFNQAFQKLNQEISILRGYGLEESADYFLRYAKRLSGEHSEYGSYSAGLSQRMKLSGLQLGDIARGELAQGRLFKGYKDLAGAKLQEFAGDFTSWAIGNFYKNVLGWSTAPITRNMLNNYATGAPEIGGVYGYSKVNQGFVRGAMEARKLAKAESGLSYKTAIPGPLRLDLMEKFLHKKGLIGANTETQAVRQADVGNRLKKIPGLGHALGVLDWAGELGMWGQKASDVATRYSNYWTAHGIAEDMLAGRKAAQSFILNMSEGGKGQVYQALKLGSREDLTDTLAKYLNAKTLFNYGPANLNEVGRDWGRLVSMFSMWPSMTISSFTEQMGKHGISPKSARYLAQRLAPLAALWMGNLALHEMDLSNKPAKKLLLGRSLLQIHPLSAALGVSLPPSLQTATDAVKLGESVLEIGNGGNRLRDDLAKIGTKTAELLAPYMPGGYIYMVKKRIDNAFDRTKGK